MSGKGDKQRPISVSSRDYEDNWERTFGSKKRKMEQKIQELQADIDKVRDMLDHYSGLPNTASYDNKGEYHASERDQDYRQEP
jgi:hypothetical protein